MAKPEHSVAFGGLEVGIDEIAKLQTQFDVIRFLKRLTEGYGFKTFIVLNVPTPTSRALSTNTIVTNWPAELTALFDREGLMQTSAVLQRLRQSSLPFTQDLDREALANPDLRPVRELFAPYGIVRSVYLPVHDSLSTRGAVAFGGTGRELDRQQIMELLYVSVHVFDRLSAIRRVDIRPTDVLTERETDCLNWTAAGKTSAEIAEILGLSEHTVNHYLNRAAKKLDTVNRTQAVAKALRVGLIK